MEIAHTDTAMQMAAENLGVCFTRESYAMQFQYVKRPAFLAIGDPPVEKPLYATYRKEAGKVPHVLYLVELIQKIVEDVITRKMD